MGLVASTISHWAGVTSDTISHWGDVTLKSISDVGQGIDKFVTNALKDPLPTILQIGGSMVGIPPYVTAAAITAYKGGDLADIARTAAFSYATSSFLTNTQFGADILNETANTWAGDFTDSIANTFDLPIDQASLLYKTAYSSLSTGVIGGLSAALTGKSIAQGISSGMLQGAVYSATDSYFTSVNKDQNWGLSETSLNLLKGLLLYLPAL